jgi:hypothetical protein
VKIVVVVCTEDAVIGGPYLVETTQKVSHREAKRRYSMTDATEAGATALPGYDVT